MTTPEPTFKQPLADYLAAQTGADVTISDMKPLSGGASRDTWRFTAHIHGDSRAYVLRRDLPTQMFADALTRAQEFTLMHAAYETGVKVAPVRYLCEDTAILGGPFFIMDYVPGVSIGRKVLKAPELAEARRQLPQQMARQLATIHQIDPNRRELAFLPRPTGGRSAAETVLDQTYALLDALGVKNPAWEWALRWASRHAPRNGHNTFVHGDFRIGNLLVDANGLAAVIDWEFGHIGDPDEELGYVCMRDWRFGNGSQRFAGLGPREPFLQMYEQFSGRSVDRDAVDWWEIVGNIRWGVICLSQANRHLSGEDPSVELASLGRRSAEMQLEALRLIRERIG